MLFDLKIFPYDKNVLTRPLITLLHNGQVTIAGAHITHDTKNRQKKCN